MDGSLTEWEWLAFATCQPNGLVNARCLGSRRRSHTFELCLCLSVSVSGKRDFKTRDNSAEIFLHAGIGLCRDHCAAHTARQFGAFWRKAGNSQVRESAWWRTQSPSSLSQHQISLLAGK